MVIDDIRNIEFYEPVAPGITEAWEQIKKQLSDNCNLADGRYELEKGFYKIQRGETKPLSEGTFESHRKYIDVQILLEGQEEVAWMELSNLEEAEVYNAEKDAARWNGKRSHHMLISSGMFYIAYPRDGHKSVSHIEHAHFLKKIILKLPIS